jgi:hypothetical protein
MRSVSGLAPFVGALGGLIVWAAHFGLVYVANAIACERDLAGRTVLGLPLVPVLVLGASALALLVLGVIASGAERRLRRSPAGEPGEEDDERRFLARLGLAVALVAALAILWQSVPALILRPCG